MRSDQTIEITTGTLARFLLMVVGLIFLYVIRDIVLIILVSVVIASSVDPLIRWLCRRHIPRVLAVLAIYLGGIAFFVSVVYFLIPPLIHDFASFFQQLPELLDHAFVELRNQFFFLPIDYVLPALRDFAVHINENLAVALQGYFGATESLFSKIFASVFIFVISFYLAVQKDGVGDALRVMTPQRHEKYVLDLWARSQRKIGRWLQGQLLLGVIIGVLVFIALTILQVRYAFILAILSALFEMIPYFGPVLAAIPAIIIASIQQPLLGLIVLCVFVLVQQMENHLIYPQVVRKTVGVPPLLAIIALLIGGEIAGMMGFVIAIPFAVVFVEFLDDVEAWKKRE